MTKQVYKTAQGKTVDMGALRLQNESQCSRRFIG